MLAKTNGDDFVIKALEYEVNFKVIGYMFNYGLLFLYNNYSMIIIMQLLCNDCALYKAKFCHFLH